jgi:hypothetical protein
VYPVGHRILVADVPQMDGRYAEALAGQELAFVRTIAEARQALAASGCGLVLIGVHFDDSRMFDLVRVIRDDHDGQMQPRQRLPIVCVRGQQAFAAVTSRTLEVTVKALAADEFVDLVQFGDDAAGNAVLREVAERLVAR